jgi:hypothetical protein
MVYFDFAFIRCFDWLGGFGLFAGILETGA